jgi:hypothetical protein
MGQSKMKNPEKLATYGTQDEDKQIKIITQYALDTTTCKQKTNNVNKTCVLLQTTGGNDELNIVFMRNNYTEFGVLHYLDILFLILVISSYSLMLRYHRSSQWQFHNLWLDPIGIKHTCLRTRCGHKDNFTTAAIPLQYNRLNLILVFKKIVFINRYTLINERQIIILPFCNILISGFKCLEFS